MDLEQLANVATTGGITALEELATTGKVTPPPVEEEAEPNEAAAEGLEPTEPTAEETPAKTEPEEKEHATAVSTKDGKGTIPYSVLKGARERATQFESENAELRKQIDALAKQPGSATVAAETVKTTGEVDEQITAMRDKVEQLKGDFPELAELMNGQIEMLKATRQQLVELRQEQEAERNERAAAEQAKVEETLQEAIDGNPILASWQTKNGPEWAAAVEMDVLLRNKPEWVEKTFSERFAKAVELVRVMNPEFEVPETEAEKTDPEPDAASPKKEAKAPPSDKRPPVNSLSDIPGGVLPAAGKREQVEELSAAALGNRFSSMTPDQISDYLATLGN
jgi:hypothetical protein